MQLKIYSGVLCCLLSGVLAFDFPTEESVCPQGQECKFPRDCPSVVRDFREKKITPTICNFRVRSLSVCCKKDVRVTKPVETDHATSLVCGKKNVKKIFQFQLAARQGNFGNDAPVKLLKSDVNPENEVQVVGGNEVEENAYPWMAALGSKIQGGSDNRFRWFCGGSLIDKDKILTAAHCVQNSGFTLDVVRLGAHNLGESEFEDVDDYVPKRIVVHPEYKEEGVVAGGFPEHDIAIIFLNTDNGSGVKIRQEVGPVCLPQPSIPVQAGAPVLVTGWGATSEGGILADRLQEVTVKVTDPKVCKQRYRQLAGVELGPGILCAGHSEGGRDACQGDSGGPLVSSSSSSEGEDTSFTLVGVVSAGIGCARRDVPGLYTDVAHHMQWIQSFL